MDIKYESVQLKYSIYKYSSYSANYVPQNIMVNNPTDQASRWFTDSSTSSQYIMLKLNAPAIVETIKFGKYIKAHVSDLKRFQVLGGTEPQNLSELLLAGLKKDNAPESFRIRQRTSEGLYLPVQYIKIVPLQSWGPAYNYTIWYVELHGKNHEDLVNNALDTINLRKEEEAVRILLKHLRRRRYKDAFEALSRESGVKLEGDLQARLWHALVENGDYKLSEDILDEAIAEGEFDWYMSWQPYRPTWRQLSSSPSPEESPAAWQPPPPPSPPPRAPDDVPCADRDPARVDVPSVSELCGSVFSAQCGAAAAGAGGAGCGGACCASPGPRGGHQLVVDPTTGTLYLFGGWNGVDDLDDLWAYDTTAEKWTLLCRHSALADGPSPRSCHKMVFDPVCKRLYTLGRYLDNTMRLPKNMNSDLYMYDVGAGAWSLVCADTAAAGGPRLVFDHQMCIDADARTVYVFGGRVLPANTEEAACPQYSGLYAYYLASNTWQLLLADGHSLPAPQPRVSHSMLFHPVQRRLYIFAGQRNKEHLLDLWWWDVGSGRCGALCSGAAACPPPAAGFTQRATLDPDTDEMFVLSGMSKEKDKLVHNSLWVLSLRRLTWACVYRSAAASSAQPEPHEPHEPRPRFAHQLVLDPVKKIHYLFGGNPGSQKNLQSRLDDLWSLRLQRSSLPAVARAARRALREARYRELAACPARHCDALGYLRNELHDVLDHSDPNEVEQFQKLACVLFSGGSGGSGGGAAEEAAGARGAALCPRRSRALARRRREQCAPADLALALHAVLGADDVIPEPTQPFEDILPPAPDTWDVGEDSEEPSAGQSAEWELRANRIALYDQLCKYFQPSVVPPRADITDLVKL